MALTDTTRDRLAYALRDRASANEVADAVDVGAALSAAELGFLDTVVAGTGAVSKALVLDANGDVTMPDLGSIGFGGVGKLSWDTTDANANEMLIQLPPGGSTDVPVIVIGQSIEAVDLGLFNGVVDPKVAMLGVGAVTTGPTFEFRKARGTAAAPTVVTSGDDIGQVRFFGCVANGEYVQGASIEADMAGTIATTRGPSTLTFKTATDAAPSVLTSALVISAAQNVLMPVTATIGSDSTDRVALKGIYMTPSNVVVAVPAITDPDIAKVDVSVAAAFSMAPAVGDAVIAIPQEAMESAARILGCYVTGTDQITVVFGSEGGNVTGGNKNFKFLVIDVT